MEKKKAHIIVHQVFLHNQKHSEYQLPNYLIHKELINRYIYMQYAKTLHRIKYEACFPSMRKIYP